MKNTLKKVLTIGAAIGASIIAVEIVDNHIWTWRQRRKPIKEVQVEIKETEAEVEL